MPSLSTGYGGGCWPIVMASALTYGGGLSWTTTGTGGNLGNYLSKFFTVYEKSTPKSGAFVNYFFILFVIAYIAFI